MQNEGYAAVRDHQQGAGVVALPCGVVSLLGRDRQSFLQGQVTNDVVRLTPGHGMRACLLDNRGHMLADLSVYAFADQLLIDTDPTCAGVVVRTLDRYLVREKVQIEDVTAQWQIVCLLGQGALGALRQIVQGEAPLVFNGAFSHVSVRTVLGDVEAFVIHRPRTAGADGYDLWLPAEYAPGAITRLKAVSGVVALDEAAFEILRIEGGIPAWGSELDESVIPLEAGLTDAISFTKGCYVGQEIIARIRARGHTNRTLMGLKLSQPVAAGAKLVTKSDAGEEQEAGWVTSSCMSPALGPIAMGYVRNEHAHEGAELLADEAVATVCSLPFEMR